MPAHNAPAAQTFDGSGLKILIIHARWNTAVVTSLVDGATRSLLECGVKPENVCVESVPGSYELPRAVAVAAAYQTPPYDYNPQLPKHFNAIIAIGCLIKGETMHFEYIADAVSHGLMKIQIDYPSKPVIFGLLTCLNEEQARARAGLVEGKSNAGEEWGRAAVEMVVKEGRWYSGRFETVDMKGRER